MKKAILVSCFDWYKKRLEPIREILIERGYDVVVLTSDYDHIKKETIKTRFEEVTYIHVPEYKKNLSYDRIKSHLTFAKKVDKIINEWQPELVYCLAPVNYAVYKCGRYKVNNSKTKLIIDIIDLWPESMPLGKLNKTFIANVWRKWRDDTIGLADYVFTECDWYKEKLASILSQSKSSTLHLCKEQTLQEKQLIYGLIENNKPSNAMKFAYVGSMNNILDIDGISDVINSFIREGVSCEFHAIGDGSSKDLFENAIIATGCKTFFYGLIFDEKEKIKILTNCDYAFNMMKDTVEVGLTIKSIDYLSYGLPIINNIKGDTWRLVEDEKIGVNVKNKNIDKINIQHRNVINIFEKKFTKDVFKINVRNAFDTIGV